MLPKLPAPEVARHGPSTHCLDVPVRLASVPSDTSTAALAAAAPVEVALLGALAVVAQVPVIGVHAEQHAELRQVAEAGARRDGFFAAARGGRRGGVRGGKRGAETLDKICQAGEGHGRKLETGAEYGGARERSRAGENA